MLRFLHAMVHVEGWELSDVLQFMTINPARVLQLPHKGQVSESGVVKSTAALRCNNCHQQQQAPSVQLRFSAEPELSVVYLHIR